MAEIYATAVPVVEPTIKGVHLAWLGPPPHPHSLSGWKIERRNSGRIPSTCERIKISKLTTAEEHSSALGRIILKPGSFPDGGAPCTICTVELNNPASGFHGRIQSGIGCVVALRSGKAVAARGPLSGLFDLGADTIDTLNFYVAAVSPDTNVELCQRQYGQSDWSSAKLIAELHLPLAEFMPGLTDELAEAKGRLLDGETIDPERFADVANLLRGLQLGPRGTMLVRAHGDDEFDETSALDPIRMLYSSPQWRRVLGFGLFDRDPDLVPGESYDYRITGTFPSAARVYGFHTIPSGTQLPSDFFLHDCRIRLPAPASVELTPVAPTGALLHQTRRGIRLRAEHVTLPWTGFSIDDYSAVIDLPFAAQNLRFELEPDHDLTLEAGFGWGSFSASFQLPPGPEPMVTLPTPASQLRLRGKGFLAALIVEPASDATDVQILAGVTLVDTPRPAPPTSVSASSLQRAALLAMDAIRPRRPLGMEVEWEPATMLSGWSIPNAAAPIEAAAFQIERKIEPAGAWEPVLGADSPVFGGRDSGDYTPQVYAGSDLMLAFPEGAGPSATDDRFTHEDLFLKGDDGESVPEPPPPGTMLRYRAASIDSFGRLSAGFTEGDPARLEKHEPPPVPAGADTRSADLLPSAAPTGVTAKVLVSGGDLTAEETALLGSSQNAVVLEWGWHANEREIDPFAKQFRIYISPPLNTVVCEILSASPIATRQGAYLVSATVAREIGPDAGKGQYLSAGYPFFVEGHTGGTSIELVLVTHLAAPGGGFRVPVSGRTDLPLNYSSRFTRPDGWSERVLPPIPITAEEQYQFVLRDRLQLSEDHPRDALWIGVSAADNEPYVSDSFPGPNPIPGNESAVAAVLCQGRWHGRPHYDPPPPAADVARIVAPEPGGGNVRFTLDLGPFASAANLPPGAMLFPERLDAAELLDHCTVQGTELLGTWEEESAPLLVSNPQDQQAVASALEVGNYAGIEDRHLVLLAAVHPFASRLFRPISDGVLSSATFNETLSASAARYLYRLRRANAAGQLSAEGFVVPAVVRVPSTAGGPVPVKQPRRETDPAASVRISIPQNGDFTHVLLFQAPVSRSGGQLVRVPNRPDLHPAGHLALLMDDGSLLSAEAVQRSQLDSDPPLSSVLMEPTPANQGPIRIWAASINRDGMPSALAGPWDLNLPYPPPPMPKLNAVASIDTVQLSWSWGTDKPLPVVVEQFLAGGPWTRISAPFLNGNTGFETARLSLPARYRLKADGAVSSEVVV